MSQATLYVIDDEAAMVDILCEVAELIGLNSVGFTDANRFFSEVDQIHDHSILALDLHMPRMDGIEVLRRLADISNPPAVVLISGQDMGVLHSAEKLGRAHELEILASYGKPIPMQAFSSLLDSHAKGASRTTAVATSQGEFVPTAEDLRDAMAQGQLIPHYQPQVDIKTGAVIGVEALARWRHPDHGMIFPDQFVPLAEQHNLIGDLTRTMLWQAIVQGRAWSDSGHPMVVSVNISASDLTSLTLPEHIDRLLTSGGLDPTLLALEMTESAMMGELVTSLDTLTRLRLNGIGLSIDDFGTGYSSLSHLHRVPFSELKVDRSFISTMADDIEARAIVRTCILLGHELGMTVVAEGVETDAQLGELEEMGCDIAQGYLFTAPLPAGELTTWVESRT